MKIKLILFLFFFLISKVVSSNEREEFVMELSRITIASLCGNDVFMKMSKLKSNECYEELVNEKTYCDELVKPLVPKGEFSDVKNELKSVSLLYLNCLKGLVFEKTLGSMIKD
jgi:hypothetical protein